MWIKTQHGAVLVNADTFHWFWHHEERSAISAHRFPYPADCPLPEDRPSANQVMLCNCSSPVEAQALFDAITDWLDRDGVSEWYTSHPMRPTKIHAVFDIPKWLEAYRAKTKTNG